MCGPVSPGTTFVSNNDKQVQEFESPWWSPPSTAAQAFAYVCPGRVRTRIAWHEGTLAVSHADGLKRLLVSYKGRSIVVKSDRILLEKHGDIWTSKSAP